MSRCPSSALSNKLPNSSNFISIYMPPNGGVLGLVNAYLPVGALAHGKGGLELLRWRTPDVADASCRRDAEHAAGLRLPGPEVGALGGRIGSRLGTVVP